MVANVPNPFFTPDDSLAAEILRALAEPAASLDAVSKAHGIAVVDLALWLTTPTARDLMLTIERGGYTHVRMAASVNLSAAVGALVQILADFRASRATSSSLAPSSGSSTPSSPLRPSALSESSVVSSLRHAEIARKAAYHLYRLSRIVPIDDSKLAHARSVVRATGCSPASANDDTPSRVPPVPVEPAQQDETELVSAPSPSAPSSSSPSPSSPSRSSRSDTSSPPLRSSAPSEPSAFPSPASFKDIVSDLEELAHSLGVDTSDLDALEEMDDVPPLPPEFLATLPPELAAFLSETDPPPHSDPTSTTGSTPTRTPEVLGASP